ncbi:MAG: prenyltransferase [Peptococcaceae bacterium]|nr:prenyltransferase [Peptococcaceae bacterium]
MEQETEQIEAGQISESIKLARAYALEGGEQILRGRLDEIHGVSASPGATALATLALLLLGSKYKKNSQAGLHWFRNTRQNQGWGKVPGGDPDEEITQLVQKAFIGNRSGRLIHYFLPSQVKEVANIVLALGQEVVPGMKGPQPDETTLPHILSERIIKKLPPYGRPVVVAAALLAAQDLKQDSIGKAVTYLCDCQMDDGSWSEDIVVTSLAVIALVRAKITGGSLDKAAQWLVSKQYPRGAWPAFDQLFTWSVGLAIRCFMESGPSPAETDWIRRATPWLSAGQNADGSYGSTPPFTQPDLDDTAVALRALQLLGSPVSRHSAELLLRLQNEDGSWATFPDFSGCLPEVTCTFPIYIPSTDVTVHVLDALWGAGEIRKMEGSESPAFGPGVRGLREQHLSSGVHWLLEQQMTSGEFPGTWYEGSIYATAQILEFLSRRARQVTFWRHGRLGTSIQTAHTKALNYLVSSQNSDGSWGNSVIETSLAVSALCSVGHPLPPELLARGAAAILASQSANGSFRPSYRCIYAKGWNYEEPLTTALTAVTALERYKRFGHR